MPQLSVCGTGPPGTQCVTRGRLSPTADVPSPWTFAPHRALEGNGRHGYPRYSAPPGSSGVPKGCIWCRRGCQEVGVKQEMEHLFVEQMHLKGEGASERGRSKEEELLLRAYTCESEGETVVHRGSSARELHLPACSTLMKGAIVKQKQQGAAGDGVGA